MGHTLPTITGHFDRFRSNIALFRRALRRADQIALDSLLSEARQHLDRARAAWQEARSRLSRDLSEYERRVALKELRPTIHSWFGLTQAELAEVTQDT